MRVLFVSSGNKSGTINPIISAQGESLKNAGIDIYYLPITERGALGYFKSALRIKKFVKLHSINIIHAHYTLSGWSAVLSFTGKPIILSLMGDDAYGIYIGNNKIKFISRGLSILTLIVQPFVSAIISKSEFINSFVYRKKNSQIIPNGVEINKFKEIQTLKNNDLGLKKDVKSILFLGDKNLKRKNYQLVCEAVSLIDDPAIQIIAPFPCEHSTVVSYLNGADVFVLSAFMEGSPNVVKEAMACNCPIVSTDVGDVRWVFGDTEGCYIASFDPKDFAEKIKLALDFSEKHGRTKGRERIIELGLDSETIANKIINVYKKVLEPKKKIMISVNRKKT